MPTYDICCIASTRASPKHLTHLLKRIQGDLSVVGGMVRKIDHMGLRPLASPMRRKTKKHTVGRYFRLLVEASPKACMGIQHRLGVDDEIVRFRAFKSSLADVYKPPSSSWQHRPIMSEAHYDALRRTTNIDFYIARTLLTQGKITPEELLALGTHAPKLEPAVEAYEELTAKVPAAIARKLYQQGLIKEVAGEGRSEFQSGPTMVVAGLSEMLEPSLIATKQTSNVTDATLAELSIHNAETLNKPFPTMITSFKEESHFPLKGANGEYREDWALASPTEALAGVDNYMEPESEREDVHETFKKYIERNPDTFKADMRTYLVEKGIIADNFETLYPMRDQAEVYERKTTNTETEHIIRGRPEPDPEVPGGLIITEYHFRSDRQLLKTVRVPIEKPTEEDWAFGTRVPVVRPDRTLWDGYPLTHHLPSDNVRRRADRLKKMVSKVQRELDAARSRGLDLNEDGNLIFPDGRTVPQRPRRLSPLYGDVPEQFGAAIPEPEDMYKQGTHVEYIEKYFPKKELPRRHPLYEVDEEEYDDDEHSDSAYGYEAVDGAESEFSESDSAEVQPNNNTNTVA